MLTRLQGLSNCLHLAGT